MQKLKCVKCTSSKNGGFILKLQNKEEKSIETPFGKKTQTSQNTYYMKVDEECAVGTEAELNVDDFNVIERQYTIDDESSDLHGETIQLKWLSI